MGGNELKGNQHFPGEGGDEISCRWDFSNDTPFEKKASSAHVLVINGFPYDFAAKNMVAVLCSSKQSRGRSLCCTESASL